MNLSVVFGRWCLFSDTSMSSTNAAQVKILVHPDFDLFEEICRNTVNSFSSSEIVFLLYFLLKMPKYKYNHLVEKSTLQLFADICYLSFTLYSAAFAFLQLSQISQQTGTNLRDQIERVTSPIIYQGFMLSTRDFHF